MDFSLSDAQQLVRDTFREFSAREVRPRAAELDRTAEFPWDIFRKLGALGFFGLRYPPPDGAGADALAGLLATEELAHGSLSVAAAATMQALMGTWFVHRFADEALRERLLRPALRGERIGAICMTEPDAGSDLMALTTRAETKGGRWLLTGAKTWVTSAPVADFFTVLARTGEKELSVFLVERDARGLAIGRSIDKLGVRASLTSEVFFDAAEATCLLGERGRGGEYLREILAEIRLVTAALALGVGRAALEDALAYARTRRQFGRAIVEFQAIQLHLAEMATELEAARALTFRAAGPPGGGPPDLIQASMAKLAASEAAWRACERASRIAASYGYATDLPLERYLRDVRFTLIGGGTSEILKLAIAKGLSA